MSKAVRNSKIGKTKKKTVFCDKTKPSESYTKIVLNTSNRPTIRNNLVFRENGYKFPVYISYKRQSQNSKTFKFSSVQNVYAH